MDGHVAVIAGDVAELAVAYLSAAHAHTDGVGVVAVEDAVGDGHPLARPRVLQLLRACTQREGVVACADVAVGDDHLAAAIDVDAVVLSHVRAGFDGDALDGHVLAAVQEA